MTKDLGSVVVGEGGAELEANGDTVMNGNSSLEGEAEKTLQDARFIIGDYVSCAILPPLANGSVAPVPAGAGVNGQGRIPYNNGPTRGGFPGGPRHDYRGPRDGYGGQGQNGFGGGGAFGSRDGRRGGERDDGSQSVPMGEWRRGEQLPYAAGDSSFRRGRGRGGGY